MTSGHDNSTPTGWRFPSELGGELPVPEDWTAVDVPGGEVRAFAGPTTPPLRSNLTFTVSKLDRPFSAWVEEAERILGKSLNSFRVIERCPQSLRGSRPGNAFRLTAHHIAEDGAAVMMIQWITQAPERCLTVTLSLSPVRLTGLREYIAELDSFHGFGSEEEQ
ncbi:hypothetical protein [Arthrobacter sp. UM1]|uniref:hypothetical protein n=1 Tax=Arthrobacter sp. UM1 TaxID=2766776 RepID=UPI001CF6E75D|nr:hypothetical protein [Arthrobacter sp. UM1]MCB4208693.1 hypothetical protein [Arthrobacter sp. UM1]